MRDKLSNLPPLPSFLGQVAPTGRAEVTVRLLTTDDIDRLEQTHERTRTMMPKGVVAHDDRAFLLERIRHGVALGYLSGEEIIAYGLLGLPDQPGGELGRLIADASLHTRPVGELDGVGVLPEWQGNGLHFEMLAWRIRAATTLGRRDALATVSPDNLYSLPNMLRAALAARALVQMPHGAWRYVMHHDGTDRAGQDGVWLPLSDFDAQKDAFAHGARGTALRTTATGPEIFLTNG